MTELTSSNKHKIKTFFKLSLTVAIKTKLNTVETAFEMSRISRSIHEQLSPIDNPLTLTINNLIEALNTAVLAWELKHQKYFLSQLAYIDYVTKIIDVISDHFVLHRNFSSLPPVEINQQRMLTDTQSFFDEFIVAEDLRTQANKKDIRRLDSLARIFSLPPRYSVCLAITFHGNQLMISANVSKQGEQELILNKLIDKANALHRVIKDIQASIPFLEKNTDPESFENFLEASSHEFYLSNLKPVGSNFSGPRLEQDLQKFIHAILCDPETFDEPTRGLWQTPRLPFSIILPNKTSNSSHVTVDIMKYRNDIESGLMLTESTPLTTDFSPEAGVHTYHAEQSLAYLILKNGSHDYSEAKKLKIGVSKLCCHTCGHALSTLPVETRGSHGQAYELVANMVSDAVIPPKTPDGNFKKTETSAHNSVLNSHRKRPFIEEEEEDRIQRYNPYLMFSSPTTNQSVQASSESSSSLSTERTSFSSSIKSSRNG